MAEGKRIKFIAGVLIALIAFVASITLIVISYNTPSCELQDTLPMFNMTELENIPSSDQKSMAKFAGYLEYELSDNSSSSKHTKIYMPLAMESNYWFDKKPADPQLQQLTLETNCSRLMLDLKTPSTAGSSNSMVFTVPQIQVDLVVANGRYRTCLIDEPNISVKNSGKHYACYNERKYTCNKVGSKNSSADPATSSSRKVATLVVQVLEFEFNGNPDSIKGGNYSSPAEYC